MVDNHFVFGVDLDGVVADFYGYMRTVTAEWRDVEVDELTPEVRFGLPEWGLAEGEYERLHRFAMKQRGLFENMAPIKGAPQALRRLSHEGVRIRIITHRLYLKHSHQVAISQTVQWLEHHAVPYWDLCFMREKGDVGADIYIEDAPSNIDALRAAKKRVIVFTNSTNRHIPDGRGGRANTWDEAERLVRKRYYKWLRKRSLPLPPGPGLPPSEVE
ncbi:hypothetical protein [Streptomyces fradiae]|uniref:5' nucleotidase, NT5C type n=1 Tax=Streptomyces fradiae TaxID=1906 RepID=UPI003514924F